MEKTIRIYGKRVKNNKVDFVKYTYVNSKNVWCDVKFKRGIQNAPVDAGYYLLTIDTKDISYDKVKETRTVNGTTYKVNDVLWINSIIECKVDEEYIEELYQKREAELEALFD